MGADRFTQQTSLNGRIGLDIRCAGRSDKNPSGAKISSVQSVASAAGGQNKRCLQGN